MQVKNLIDYKQENTNTYLKTQHLAVIPVR